MTDIYEIGPEKMQERLRRMENEGVKFVWDGREGAFFRMRVIYNGESKAKYSLTKVGVLQAAIDHASMMVVDNDT